VQAYIHLQEVTGNQKYLFTARDILKKVIEEFSDEDNIFFFFTSFLQDDIIVRKKEIYDGAVPSGNAVMAYNMLYLAIVFDERSWVTRVEKMLALLDKVIIKYPSSFGFWAGLLQCMVASINEIAVIGENAFKLASLINRMFIPNKIIQSAIFPIAGMPMLERKFSAENETYIYLCRDYACEKPVKVIEDLILLLKN
jgi:uncharacterized protein YyaL (SSP411 family)